MAVGKTSLVHRFFFAEFDSTVTATVGMDFTPATLRLPTLNNAKVKVHLYDTAGMERFKSIVPSSWRGRDAYILVWDVTKPETLTELIDTWLPQVLPVARMQAEWLIIGNKLDLLSPDEQEAMKQETMGQLVTLRANLSTAGAARVNTVFTSAMTGEGVKAAFAELVMGAVSRAQPARKPAAGSSDDVSLTSNETWGEWAYGTCCSGAARGGPTAALAGPTPQDVAAVSAAVAGSEEGTE